MLQIIQNVGVLRSKWVLAALMLLISSLAMATEDSIAVNQAGTTEAVSEGTGTHGVEAHESGKFDAGKMIVEHISDSHGWHLWGHTTIPLPIIVYNSVRGFSVFSSSRFEHGHKTYGGYKLEENNIVAVNETEEMDASAATENEELTASTYDLSITKNVFALLVSIVIMLWMFLSVASSYKRRKGEAPKGMQSLIEPLVVFVRDEIAKPSIGKTKYEKYMPYLLTVFFFIWINNLLGLIPIFPGGANLTGNIAVTMTLALITFLITTFTGNKHYWRHIFAMPGVPIGVLILLTPIEILGVILRPFVLMIRLFANITAGHIIALSFFSLIFIFGEMSTGAGLGVSILSVAFVVFMTMLELLVAFLQAFVFTLLSAIYFGAAVEEHDHDHAHHDAHVEEALLI
jgi:F-type H+-transporting ATPase subunit a